MIIIMCGASGLLMGEYGNSNLHVVAITPMLFLQDGGKLSICIQVLLVPIIMVLIHQGSPIHTPGMNDMLSPDFQLDALSIPNAHQIFKRMTPAYKLVLRFIWKEGEP